MSGLKTKPTKLSARSFLASIPDVQRKRDCKEIANMMQAVTGEKPRMWGSSIVGFGSYHYKNVSGREGDWFVVGLSPRKQALTLYIMSGFSSYETLMGKLGKYKTGKSCLYIKSLDDIDRTVLLQLIKKSVAYIHKTYPAES